MVLYLILPTYLETKGINVTLDKLDLVNFCQELITEVSQTYPNYQFKFRSDISSLEAEIDFRLLRSILTNILTNAVRYSFSDRAIGFVLSISNNHAFFSIKDCGLGIPEGDLNNIFEPFHRGKNVSNIPGTGLGLNIVKRFIAFLDGEIDISSQINQGTRVEISIPLASNL